MPIQHKILAIDDESAILKLLENILRRADYTVALAKSAEEGLKLLEEDYFHCVITDAIMPNVSGFDLTEKIRKDPIYSAVPIIMLTRKRNPEDVKEAVRVGVTDYVIKPLDEQLLLEKVRLLLRKNSASEYVFELPFGREAKPCHLFVDAKITSISEAGLAVRTREILHETQVLKLDSSIFDEIGIEPPELRQAGIKKIKDRLFEVNYTFVGLDESNLRKIRAWIHRKAVLIRQSGRTR